MVGQMHGGGVRFAVDDRRLRKATESVRKARKEYGTVRGDRLIQRLNEIGDAESLFELCAVFGGNCHALKGDRKGTWGISLDRNYRLIVAPSEPVPVDEFGGIDTRRVKSVVLLGVEDYH